MSYHRKSVSHHADHSSHLTVALHKHSLNFIHWSPVVRLFLFFDQFMLLSCQGSHTYCWFFFSLVADALLCGVGCVLNVHTQGKIYLMVLFSHQLCDREQRYSATELEALVNMESLRHLNLYLSRPILITSWITADIFHQAQLQFVEFILATTGVLGSSANTDLNSWTSWLTCSLSKCAAAIKWPWHWVALNQTSLNKVLFLKGKEPRRALLPHIDSHNNLFAWN